MCLAWRSKNYPCWNNLPFIGIILGRNLVCSLAAPCTSWPLLLKSRNSFLTLVTSGDLHLKRSHRLVNLGRTHKGLQHELPSGWEQHISRSLATASKLPCGFLPAWGGFVAGMLYLFSANSTGAVSQDGSLIPCTKDCSLWCFCHEIICFCKV